MGGVIDVFEAVLVAELIAKGGAHPSAGGLGGTEVGCGGGEGGAVMGVVEDLEAIFGNSGSSLVIFILCVMVKIFFVWWFR